MLEKTINKDKRKRRKLWTNFYKRYTPTRREKEIKEANKHKHRNYE